MNNLQDQILKLEPNSRIRRLKKKIITNKRFISIEQAKIITRCYQDNPNETNPKKRALSFAKSCELIDITIDEDELIVGNRTKNPRDGVVFPEGGISWLKEEIDLLPDRDQDPFQVRDDDRKVFFDNILPFWENITLEDSINNSIGDEIRDIKSVVKINQTDHAQGHICPDSKKWLEKGPAGIREEAIDALSNCVDSDKREFYECVIICMDGAIEFIRRYSDLAQDLSLSARGEDQTRLNKIAEICNKLSTQTPDSYSEALQSIWFLFVLLHLESNASSFSPGRMDQFLYPYFERSIKNGEIDIATALEWTEALYIKFNEVVYLRNDSGARYFAGFPIGFNVALGGHDQFGNDNTNLLSYLFLQAQKHVRLPQPNLSVRLHKNTPDKLLEETTRVISQGGGLPQVFNDESIIPALIRQGIKVQDAYDYAIVGCVELTTQGNNLGWSDAAMFNMVKVLELALNNGICMITGKQLGPETGYLDDFDNFRSFEDAFKKQVDYFINKMIPITHIVDALHAKVMPSAFLSSVINDCLGKGLDVTAGGANYNYSGIQLIQVANIADSLAALKTLVFDTGRIDKSDLLQALRGNFENEEVMRQTLLTHAPKYGNDIEWVDQLAVKWHSYFAERMEEFENVRGGPTHTGLYTVSAHVPMGLNVAATPDGRLSKTPLADGGVSAVYGRDKNGPTALLNSVSRLRSQYASNGSLLNMKFLPNFFSGQKGIDDFCFLLRLIVELKINHCQINVVSKSDLIAAKSNPEEYSGLTVRVAGYTAFFVDLATDLQDEIIERTSFGA